MLILVVISPLFVRINENFSVFSGNLSSGTGVGIYDLPRYLTWSGLRKAGDEKPLFVALTHAHFDHSGEELFIENFFSTLNAVLLICLKHGCSLFLPSILVKYQEWLHIVCVI